MADEPAGTPAPAATADPPQDPPKATEPSKVDPPKDPPKDPDALGDAGKAALDAERAARKVAEKAARDAQSALKKREDADKSEHERAVDAAREEGKTEVTTAFQKRLLSAEVRARAAGKFANPALALKLVDFGENDAKAWGEDGEINAAAIDAEITRLLDAEPYLKAKNGATAPAGDLDGGKGAGAKTTVDMNDLIRGRRG